jgi:hypothetical protein
LHEWAPRPAYSPFGDRAPFEPGEVFTGEVEYVGAPLGGELQPSPAHFATRRDATGLRRPARPRADPPLGDT